MYEAIAIFLILVSIAIILGIHEAKSKKKKPATKLDNNINLNNLEKNNFDQKEQNYKYENIKKLTELYDCGLISPEEYKKEKEKILNN